MNMTHYQNTPRSGSLFVPLPAPHTRRALFRCAGLCFAPAAGAIFLRCVCLAPAAARAQFLGYISNEKGCSRPGFYLGHVHWDGYRSRLARLVPVSQ